MCRRRITSSGNCALSVSRSIVSIWRRFVAMNNPRATSTGASCDSERNPCPSATRRARLDLGVGVADRTRRGRSGAVVPACPAPALEPDTPHGQQDWDRCGRWGDDCPAKGRLFEVKRAVGCARWRGLSGFTMAVQTSCGSMGRQTMKCHVEFGLAARERRYISCHVLPA